MSIATLNRRAVVATILRDPGDMLVVAGLGSATYDVGAAGDRPQNFYLWGAMGGAVMIGLGLAIAQPSRRVLVITGDGEMLMGIGSLATAAAQAPDNLSVVVLDNAQFGETGAQTSHTGLGTNLTAVAAACGWPATAEISDEVGRREPGPAATNRKIVRRGAYLPGRGAAFPAAPQRRGADPPHASGAWPSQRLSACARA